MKIIYVHHGNRAISNPPKQTDDLTELGYKDCALVAEMLSNEKIKNNIKRIYTSPFFRCKKTAEIINEKLGVQIVEDERLNEFVSTENETWVEAQTRILSCINDIVKKHNNKNDIVLCVTSGVNIAAFILKAFGILPNNNVPFLGVPSCSPIMFEYK